MYCLLLWRQDHPQKRLKWIGKATLDWFAYLATYIDFLYHQNYVTWEYTSFGGILGSRKVHKTRLPTLRIHGKETIMYLDVWEILAPLNGTAAPQPCPHVRDGLLEGKIMLELLPDRSPLQTMCVYSASGDITSINLCFHVSFWSLLMINVLI